MKLIVSYSGGFQPFGPHHLKNYQLLCKMFGVDNVFICTSDHQTENRPLNFQEKKKCIEQYNINKNNIIQVKNPYNAIELTRIFNPYETSMIYAFGEKDNSRFKITNKSYFQEYYGQKYLNPILVNSYLFELPHISVKHNGKEISGTYLREVLPLATRDEFEQIMGYYNQELHFLFKKKFHPDIIDLTERLIQEGNTITKTQLQRIEQYADQLFKHFNIDVNFQDLSKATHFWQRINDPRNITPITTEELRQLFKKASLKYGEKLSKVQTGYEAILKDMKTDINLPFMIVFNRKNNELDLIPKTIMRKSNFTDKQKPFLKMESYSKHIKHIYEEQGFDFNDFVRVLLQDTNEIEYCTLKLDGYNLKLTFKANQFKVARNKTEILNPLSFQELLTKYQSKPTNQYVFKTAMIDLGNSLKQRFNLQTLNQIFQNGRNYLNFEIYHPKILNIYDYGKEPFLSIHSLISYDTSGNQVYQHINLQDFENLGKGSIYDIKITPKFQLQPHQNPNEVIQRLNQITDIKERVLYLENEVIKNFINQNEFDFNLSHINKIVNIAKQLSQNDLTSILKKIEQFGGFNPIEGLVFKYKGSIYKCTGTFGLAVPIFQIYNKNRFN